MIDLAAWIDDRAADLVGRTVTEMYRNPFWHERFGERGRQFAESDGRHHLTYLTQALRAGSPDSLTAYARWLQSVLTTRGLCSRHLADNFDRLATALAETGVAGVDVAVAYLAAARQALIYDHPAARAVQLAAAGLADRAVTRIAAERPDRGAAWADSDRARCRDDLIYHLDYLADGLALERTDLFTDYLIWIAGFLARRGVSVAHLAAALDALAEELAGLPPEAGAAAGGLLATGRAGLRETIA